VQYHFPEESVQIRRLVAPADRGAGLGDEPGMSAEAASFAVLGLDVEELGVAVAQYWGFGDTVLHMIRRLSLTASVHTPDSDIDVLRITASCANDLIDATVQPPKRAAQLLRGVVQRYGRALGLGGRDMQQALQLEIEAGSDTPAAGDEASAVSLASRMQRPVSARPLPPAAAHGQPPGGDALADTALAASQRLGRVTP